MTQLFSDLGAAEIWEYSQNKMLYDHNTTPAIARYVPPHDSHYLDYGIDLDGGIVYKNYSTCLLQSKKSRDPRIMKAVAKVFRGSLRELQVDPAAATLSAMRSAFMDCAIGLNLHALSGDRSVGQVESFQMALFLSNKMRVMSEGLDPAEIPIWDGLVQTPGVWKPDLKSRLAGLEQLLLLVQELREDSIKLAECRRTSHELYKQRFSSEQAFSIAGINATTLMNRPNERHHL
ncbi:unnamed protein product [Prorocentrum cordatum]|uniref:Uncharacterized protein n=1 Tax=Prorocentrum cordatum TaxID=2364126 RepID=A0ABN9RJ37_9DINO|nr:unnamed protein product [Polarella glacialis]